MENKMGVEFAKANRDQIQAMMRQNQPFSKKSKLETPVELKKIKIKP